MKSLPESIHLKTCLLDLIECLKNYGRRFMTLYRRQCTDLFGDVQKKKNVKKEMQKKKKCKKAKWLPKEALQIAVNRREVKDKGEKERYTHLNAEFQRIARRDKKAFLRDQCKEIEEKNRVGKTEISSRKLETPREHFMQRWAQ